jgi:hypothetical protein
MRLLPLLLVVTLLDCGASAQSQSRTVSFDIFSSDKERSDLIHDETKTARPAVIARGNRFFQVFTDKRTGRELFRFFIGTKEAKYWVYGLVQEDDFNGDGIPDFCWHGGDDTSDTKIVLFSSPRGYQKVDVEQSLQREWKRRFPSQPLEDLSESATAEIEDLKVTRQGEKVFLQALVRYTNISGKHFDDPATYVHRLRIPQSRLVVVK